MAGSATRPTLGPWHFMLWMGVKAFLFMWIVGACEALQTLPRDTLFSHPGYLALHRAMAFQAFFSPYSSEGLSL